jgi:uncharacterized protein (TIGR04255 family)
MVAPRHLEKAPAREALIDIQFEPHVSLATVDRFVSVASPKFTRTVDLVQAVVGLSNDGSAAHASHAVLGRRLDVDNPPHVLQCRTSGFTFSRLSPYGDWGDFRDAAKGWWEIFSDIVRPEVINRVAVRYVNAIRLPLPFKDFDEYLVCPPKIPDALPQALSSFLQRVVIPDEVNDCTSIVTQALEDQSTSNDGKVSVTVLLDIDVFRSTRIDRQNHADLWAGLDTLRMQKNRIFFESLTERTMELFK